MNQSILARGTFTFLAHGSKSLITVVTGFLLARLMGPDDFGLMSFLIATFVSFRGLIDLGSSSAFYTFISGGSERYSFFIRYFFWLGLQLILPLIIIALVFPDKWIVLIWQQGDRFLILLAFCAVFSQHSIWATVAQIGDSERRTYLIQTAAFLISVCHLLVVIILWYYESVGIVGVLVATLVEHVLTALVVYRMLNPKQKSLQNLQADDTSTALRRFIEYCKPLVPYIFCGFFASFGDRWILQNFSGSSEQAFYAVGWQFSSIALLATMAFTRIFWKEIAAAHSIGDAEKLNSLYSRFTTILYFISTVIACALVFWTEELIILTLGDEYSSGSLTLMILLFIPLHQSLGQIQGAFLYATENSKLLAVVGSITLMVGLFFGYLMMAPSYAAIPGLHLGASGLAAKVVAFQIINVNVLNYLISSKMGWKFKWGYQFAIPLLCLAIGWLSSILSRALVNGILESLLVYLIIYGVFIALSVFLAPRVIGLTRDQLFDRSTYFT